MTVNSIFYVLMATWGQFDCITPAREPCGGAETGTNISSNHLVNLTPPLQEGHNESSSAIKPTLKSSLKVKLHIQQ